MGGVMQGRPLVAGDAAGDLLASTEPLSFWGGYDQTSGEIIDRRHPLSGQNAAGKILALPLTRGSSTTTAVLLEAVRRELGPAAIITDGTDTFLTLASIVADEMYQRPIPIVAVSTEDFATLQSASRAHVHADGRVDFD
jgi:predicted aconitase with swiveling domain